MSSSEDSDLHLLRRASDGDPHAFHILYLRHRDFVYRVARRYSSDNESALDTTQDVFLYLLKKLPTLKLTSKLTTYLYPITKNIALTRRRTTDRRTRLNHIALPQTTSSQLHIPLDTDLAAALETLSDDHREVLLMRIVDELSIQEVAAALNIPLGTVKSRLHHALSVLRANPRLNDLWNE